MIPLRSTERVHSRTPVVTGLIAVNLAIFLFQASLDPLALNLFAERWGIVPDQFHITALVTSMFLHGGWLHVLGNMLFLWVFGRNLEDIMGSGRFLIFYLVCGVVAGIVHVVLNPYLRVPTIGASGAIAGVMGAYLIRFPRSAIITLVPVFVFITTLEVPSWLLLLYWFAIQFFRGLGSLAETDYTGGGVAWFAHVGGFVAGMLLVRLFPARQKWRSWYDEE
jgi:membrane associated rhomboid family serine protease